VPVAVVVPVGPQPAELDRLVDLAASVGCYEPGRSWLVMVDDHDQPRGLDKLVSGAGSFRPVALHHPRRDASVAYRKGKGICTAVLMALRWVQAETDATSVLKLDTDSLVIGPFSERIERCFAQQPDVAMIGAYDRTPNGTERDVRHHGRTVMSMLNPSFDWRHPRAGLRARFAQPMRMIRSHIARALRNGYSPGEHCLGGGYALCRRFIDRMAGNGFFDHAQRWMNVDLPEDVMIGIYVRACAMRFANFVDEQQVFGVRHQGLPDVPAQLVRRGYAVIHALKNDARSDEPTLRAFFRARRDPAGGESSMRIAL
jgi:hypothetical protein